MNNHSANTSTGSGHADAGTLGTYSDTAQSDCAKSGFSASQQQQSIILRDSIIICDNSNNNNTAAPLYSRPFDPGQSSFALTSVLTANELEQIQQAKIALGLASTRPSVKAFPLFDVNNPLVRLPPIKELDFQYPTTGDEESRRINEQINRKRSLSTSSAPILPYDIVGINNDDQRSRNENDDDTSDALIKPHELSNLNAFFDHELDNSTCNDDLDNFALFNNEEHQGLMEFLDAFIEPDQSHSNQLAPISIDYSPPALSLTNVLPVIPEVQEPSVPGTVAIPVIAPRKKRHTSKELLTEEERRANHIASEQKRRRNIKAGFEALQRLVPSLSQETPVYLDGVETDSSSNLPNHQHTRKRRVSSSLEPGTSATSKTFILTKAIEYLQYLSERNRRLNERYLTLKNRCDSTYYNHTM